jgi:hypothetical protein
MSDPFLYICFFITIPALIAIIVELYSFREQKDSDQITFWTWTFTNPVGVVLLPLFFYFILLLNSVNWKYESLTSINISASLGIPLIFSGILAVNSYIFNLNQEATKVSIKEAIIAELRIIRAEDNAAHEKSLADQKASNEKSLAELQASLAALNASLKETSTEVNQLNIDKAVREALAKRDLYEKTRNKSE